MRKLAVLVVLLGSMAFSGTQANDVDTWHDITFNAPVPCSVVCPYWLDQLNTDLEGNGKEDIYFQACANPEGTADGLTGAPGVPWTKGTVYDDVVVGPTPEGSRLLEFQFTAAVDWDGFICEWLPGDVAGGELGISTDPIGQCEWIPGGGLSGCLEAHDFEAVAGRKYIVRAYNWSDPLPLQARYRFRGV